MRLNLLRFIKYIFLIGGIILIFGGCMTLQTDKEYKKSGVKTDAYIERIEVEQQYINEKYHYYHHVFVSFEVDGEIYGGELNYYDSSMNEGDITEIYYMPDNPEHFICAKNGSIVSILLVCFGVAFEIIFVIWIIIHIKLNKSTRAY